MAQLIPHHVHTHKDRSWIPIKGEPASAYAVSSAMLVGAAFASAPAKHITYTNRLKKILDV